MVDISHTNSDTYAKFVREKHRAASAAAEKEGPKLRALLLFKSVYFGIGLGLSRAFLAQR